MNEVNEEVGLKKQLGTVQILLYGVGTMLGAGIYVLVGKVAGYSEHWRLFPSYLQGFWQD